MNKYEYMLQQTEEALDKMNSPMNAKIQKKEFEIRLLQLENDANVASQNFTKLIMAKKLDHKAIYAAKNAEQLAKREFKTMTEVFDELFNTQVDENGNPIKAAEQLATQPAQQ